MENGPTEGETNRGSREGFRIRGVPQKKNHERRTDLDLSSLGVSENPSVSEMHTANLTVIATTARLVPLNFLERGPIF